MRGIFWGYVLAAAGFALSGWAGVPALLALCASGCVSANGCGGMTAESVRFGQARAAFLLTALCAAAGGLRRLRAWARPAARADVPRPAARGLGRPGAAPRMENLRRTP